MFVGNHSEEMRIELGIIVRRWVLNWESQRGEACRIGREHEPIIKKRPRALFEGGGECGLLHQ